MRVLILGAYGMLGHRMFLVLTRDLDVRATCRRFRKEWSNIVSEDRLIPGVQAEDLDSVKKALEQVHPDVVINCIGIVKQLEAANDPIQTISINSLFPHKLALLCRSAGIRLIHFSTDCVFSGRKGNYTEDDPSDAEDLYGRTKYLGEVGSEGCITLRSSVIGRELGTKHGLVEWFLSQRGKKVKGYAKAIYSGFTTIAMADIVAEVIRKHPRLSGVWHVASGPISKYELLCVINDTMGLGIEIERDEQFVCDRSLDGRRFVKRTGFVFPTWKEMVEGLAHEEGLYSRE